MKLKRFGNIPKGKKKMLGIGALTLFLLGLCFFLYLPKIKELKRIKVEINTMEKNIEKAQRIAKDFQPASQEEERRWKEAESRLYTVVPREKNIPQLTYELAKQGRKYNISDISFISGKDVDITVFASEEAPSKRFNQAAEIFDEDIAHFLVKLSFKANYQDLTYFLEDIQYVDHFLEKKYLIIKRDFPLISVEIVIKAYYNQNTGADS